jgi:hypothetical protein
MGTRARVLIPSVLLLSSLAGASARAASLPPDVRVDFVGTLAFVAGLPGAVTGDVIRGTLVYTPMPGNGTFNFQGQTTYNHTFVFGIFGSTGNIIFGPEFYAGGSFLYQAQLQYLPNIQTGQVDTRVDFTGSTTSKESLGIGFTAYDLVLNDPGSVGYDGLNLPLPTASPPPSPNSIFNFSTLNGFLSWDPTGPDGEQMILQSTDLTFTFSAVPEPSTLVLAGLAVPAIAYGAFLARRSRRARQLPS